MTDTLSPGGPAPRPSSRLKWLLIASLALNLLVAGAVAGRMIFGHRSGPGGGGASVDQGLMWFSHSLPPEQRDLVRQNLKAARPELRALREESVALKKQAAELLAAEPFDRAALKSAMDRVGLAEKTLRDKGVSVVLDTAEKLSPEQRQRLSEFWKMRVERHRGRRKGPPDGGPAD